MTTENLARLTTLCAAFKNAAENSALGKNPAVRSKVLASLSPSEIENMQTLMQDLAREGMTYAFGDAPSEGFLKMNIQACEYVADMFLRAATAKDIAAFVPAEMKNAQDAETLRSLGAVKLASLCVAK